MDEPNLGRPDFEVTEDGRRLAAELRRRGLKVSEKEAAEMAPLILRRWKRPAVRSD